jgi:hypothetical protein
MKAQIELVITGSDTAELFDTFKETFNEIAVFVEVSVIVTVFGAIRVKAKPGSPYTQRFRKQVRATSPDLQG